MRTIDVSFKDVEIGGIFFFSIHGFGREIEQFEKIGSEIAEGIFSGKQFFWDTDKVKIEIDESI